MDTEGHYATAKHIVMGILMSLAVLVSIVLVANLYTAGNVVQALIYSPRRHLQRTVAKLELVKSEGYLQASHRFANDGYLRQELALGKLMED
jgi:hypothetical protein